MSTEDSDKTKEADSCVPGVCDTISDNDKRNNGNASKASDDELSDVENCFANMSVEDTNVQD
eukprot:9654604-Karenia_brevis.AAC.1